MPDIYDASKPRPVITASPEVPWRELGAISAQVTQPAVGAMSVAAVDVLTGVVVWTVPAGASNLMLRFQTSANADAQVVVVLCAPATKKYDRNGNFSLGEDYQYGGSLALTGGQQVASHSNVYVDTIVATDKTFAFTVADSAADRIASVTFIAKGMGRLCFYATTLVASSIIYPEGRWY